MRWAPICALPPTECPLRCPSASYWMWSVSIRRQKPNENYLHTHTERRAGISMRRIRRERSRRALSLCSALCNTRLHLTSTTTRTDRQRGVGRGTARRQYLCIYAATHPSMCMCVAYLLLINLTACAFAVPVTNATPGVASPAANAAADREREGKRSGVDCCTLCVCAK